MKVSERHINRSPLRKVISSVPTNSGGGLDTLECGHKIVIRRRAPDAKKRRCDLCKKLEGKK